MVEKTKKSKTLQNGSDKSWKSTRQINNLKPRRVRTFKKSISEDWLKTIVEEFLRLHNWIYEDEEIVKFDLTLNTIDIKVKNTGKGVVRIDFNDT